MADFKISAFQNPEFKVLAALKIFAFQNPAFKILVHFKILAYEDSGIHDFGQLKS